MPQERKERITTEKRKYMETRTKDAIKKVVRRRRKLTPEENRALNVAMPAGNKSIEAFRRNKGAFIVYDPTFLNT